MHSRSVAGREVDSPIQLHRGILYWAPRALAIVFAIFVSLFALDVFSERLPLHELLIALGMHLVPTAILLMLLLMSWKWDWFGVSFIALALYYYVGLAHRQHFALALVAIAIGLLFLVNLAGALQHQTRAHPALTGRSPRASPAWYVAAARRSANGRVK